MEQQQQYVGIDLHRRRSVIVRMNEDGQVLGVDKVVNDPVEFAMAVASAGPNPEVALESRRQLISAMRKSLGVGGDVNDDALPWTPRPPMSGDRPGV